MRKIISLFVLVMISSSLLSQNTKELSDSTNKQSVGTNNSGTVEFLRSTGLIELMKRFTIFIDDVLVCKLDEKRYSTHEVKPGLHNFSVQFGGKKPKQKGQEIQIKVEAGKTYYIQLIVETGLVYNLSCEEVTESSAKRIMSNMKPEKDCL